MVSVFELERTEFYKIAKNRPLRLRFVRNKIHKIPGSDLSSSSDSEAE